MEVDTLTTCRSHWKMSCSVTFKDLVAGWLICLTCHSKIILSVSSLTDTLVLGKSVCLCVPPSKRAAKCSRLKLGGWQTSSRLFIKPRRERCGVFGDKTSFFRTPSPNLLNVEEQKKRRGILGKNETVEKKDDGNKMSVRGMLCL